MEMENLNIEKLAEEIAVKVIEKMKNTSEESGRLYSRKEACNILNCSAQTLWRFGKNGLLTPVKFGGKVMYREADIKRISREGTSR